MLRACSNRFWRAAGVVLCAVALQGCGGSSGSSRSGSVAGYVFTAVGNLEGYLAEPVTRTEPPSFVLLSAAPDPAQYRALPNTTVRLEDAVQVRQAQTATAQGLTPAPVITSAETQTDGQGAYTFTGLAAGKYLATLGTKQTETQAVEVFVYPGQTTRGTEAPAVSPELLVPTFSLLTQVPSNAAFAPVAGATVGLRNTPWQVVTDASGYYAMGGLPAGYYFLQVAKDGFASRDYYISIGVGQVTYGPYSPLSSSSSSDLTFGGSDTWSDDDDDDPPPVTTPVDDSAGGQTDDGASTDGGTEGDLLGDEDDLGDTLGQAVRPAMTPGRR